MTPYDRAVGRLSRREILRLASILGAGAIVAPAYTRRVLARPIFDAYPYTLSIASGDPAPDGVALWTRLAPKPLEGGGMALEIVEVDWEIGAHSRFTEDV